MPKTEFDTVIVGGGISGLACARKLYDSGKDFLLLTRYVGGRMRSPTPVNYGAAYVTEDYFNVLNYVDKVEKIRLKDTFFVHEGKFLNFFDLKNLKYFFKIIKMFFILKKFRKHTNLLRKKAPFKTIKECIEEDDFLLKYFKMPANELIKKNKLEELNELFGSPMATCTTFMPYDKMNAYHYFSCMFPSFINSYFVSFENSFKKLTKGFKGKIKLATTLKVKKMADGTFKIKTNEGIFKAKNVVLAAPEKKLRGVYPLPKPDLQQDAYVFSVEGKIKNIYHGKKSIIFKPNNDVYLILRGKKQDIIYSRNDKIDFNKYYEKVDKTGRFYWPVAIIYSKKLISQNLDKNLYLASDYNLPGLEDSFLTGLYAANAIIGLDK